MQSLKKQEKVPQAHSDSGRLTLVTPEETNNLRTSTSAISAFRRILSRISSSAICLYLSLFVAINLLVVRYEHEISQERAHNLMTDTLSESNGTTTFDRSVGEATQEYWGLIPDGRSGRLAILLGMSQTYSINDRQNGDLALPDLLHENLGKIGVESFGLLAPNLANEEALFLFLATLTNPKTKPKALIFGACFDKFRNVDLRPGYQRFMSSLPGTSALWSEVSARYRTSHPEATSKMVRTLQEIQTATIEDEGFEGRVRDAVSRVIPIVRARKQLQGDALNKLYELRNRVFRIKTSSKRPMLASRYLMNKQFVEILIAEAQRNGVKLIFYVNPLNPQGENPYVAEEYEEFKQWMANVASSSGISFANFESIVPAADWGMWLDGPDFKHFKAAGHRILSEAITKRFEDDFREIAEGVQK